MNAFLGECPQKALAPSFCQIVFGIVPVCGFGTFAPGCAFQSGSPWADNSVAQAGGAGLVFNDVWPNVFLTLTETFTSTQIIPNPIGGGSTTLVISGTRTTTYAQTVDNFVIQTVEFPPGGYNPWGDDNDFGFVEAGAAMNLSADGTLIGSTWSQPNSGGSAVINQFTATVSNRLNAASSWAAWTAQANALLNTFNFPAWNDPALQVFPPGDPLPGTCAGWMLFPTSTAPFVSAPNGLSGPWSTLVMAAANGIAGRIAITDVNPLSPTGTGVFDFTPDTPAPNAWVQDTPDPATLGYTKLQPNCGAVVSIKSQWQLLGEPTAFPVMPSAPYNHLAGTWSQPMVVGPPPTFESSYEPYIKLATNQIVQYTPADVLAALGAGACGILGFRPPPP